MSKQTGGEKEMESGEKEAELIKKIKLGLVAARSLNKRELHVLYEKEPGYARNISSCPIEFLDFSEVKTEGKRVIISKNSFYSPGSNFVIPLDKLEKIKFDCMTIEECIKEYKKIISG